MIDRKFIPLLEQAKNKLPLSDWEKDILELGEEVIALYGTMDDSLQFKGKEKVIERTEEKQKNQEEDIPVKDFRGVGCPMNFVKTKLALATISEGSLLEIWLDDGAPIENVPGSIRNEGHEIVSAVQVKDYWVVRIRKQSL